MPIGSSEHQRREVCTARSHVGIGAGQHQHLADGREALGRGDQQRRPAHLVGPSREFGEVVGSRPLGPQECRADFAHPMLASQQHQRGASCVAQAEQIVPRNADHQKHHRVLTRGTFSIQLRRRLAEDFQQHGLRLLESDGELLGSLLLQQQRRRRLRRHCLRRRCLRRRGRWGSRRGVHRGRCSRHLWQLGQRWQVLLMWQLGFSTLSLMCWKEKLCLRLSLLGPMYKAMLSRRIRKCPLLWQLRNSWIYSKR
mmetsp:Transcript_75619/g.245869  ORF Transcript_75619/g.245869 Transcript_75619/m.245869 type:complete len:254 (-) Transcript_75619:473-1234(-)